MKPSLRPPPEREPSPPRPGELALFAFIGKKLAEIETKYPGARKHVEEIMGAVYGATSDW